MTKQTPDPAAGASRWEAPAAGSSRPATDLARPPNSCSTGGARQLDSAALRDALLDLHEFWLTTKAAEIGITPTSGFAIVATGGLGRGELLPYSDLDLTLVHDNMPRDVVSQVAELLWYPLWDANIRIDHSVRTVPEALKVAGEDISAGLAMLEARHIAGDADLSALLDRWGPPAVAHRNRFALRRTRRAHPGAMAAQRSDRPPRRARPEERPRRPARRPAAQRAGDRAAGRRLSEPVAGLADRHRWATRTWRCSTCAPNCTGSRGRGREMLLAQYADEIGAALHIGDRFDLARMLSDAARTISYYVDAGHPHRGECVAAPRFVPRCAGPCAGPLDEGVIEFARRGDPGPRRPPGTRSRPDPAGGRGVGHHRTADVGVDAEPAGRDRAGAAHAVAAPGAQGPAGDAGRRARHGGHHRGARPNRAVGQAVSRMGCGARPAAARRRAHLDRRPAPRRNRLARKRIHHPGVAARSAGARCAGATTSARAAAATTASSAPSWRPRSAPGWGCGRPTSSCCPRSCATTCCCRDTATRRDLQDPKTIAAVVDALDGDPVLLELLHALAEADSLATGPGVWGDWKASLIGDLVRRCRLVMAGEPLPQPDPIEPRHLSLAADGGVHVELTPGDSPHIYNVTMIAPDRRGLLSKAAGVLALNSLRVHSASVNGHDGVGDQHVRRVTAFRLAARRRAAAPAVHPGAGRRARRASASLNERDRDAAQPRHHPGRRDPRRGADQPRPGAAADPVVRRAPRRVSSSCRSAAPTAPACWRG